MKHPNHILRKVLFTEKSMLLQEKENSYMIEVDKAARKHDIKRAVEDFFNVTVLSVNTQNVKEKNRILRNRRTVKGCVCKRALVTLKEGDTIDLL